MPIFYLHVGDASGFAEDMDGLDCPDLPAALKMATEGLRDILAGELRNGSLDTASFIEIENDRHELVATVSFGDVVTMRGGAAARPPR